MLPKLPSENAQGARAELAALLDAEREFPSAPQALKERSFGRAQFALEARLHAMPKPQPSPRSGVFPIAGLRWLTAWRPVSIAATVFAFAGLSAAAIAVQRYVASAELESQAPFATPKAQVRHNGGPVAAPAEAADEVPVISIDSLPRAVSTPREHAAAPAVEMSDPRELGLLQSARGAIASGQHGAALSLLSEHRTLFPSGVLSQERAALHVKALWGSGDRAAARSAAAQFRQQYPKSGLLTWMKE